MKQHLQSSWQRAWRGVGAVGDGLAWCERLLACYQEPHRHYHTLQHLGECLAAFDQARALAPHPDEIALALWFHDAIYDVKRSDNEARMHTLIMATRHDAVPADADAQLLVDIDLGILGADTARFAEYEAQIRREYAFVPGWLFRHKRRAILQGFLERPRLYTTPYFHDRLETRARENLARAVA
jgi:predicted metal-dependent HD superfamily phosphohydrolase